MKILFTQFTPPFAQIHSSLIGRKNNAEKKYLEYRDWYSELRRLSALHHSVKFISLTNKKEIIRLNNDVYESLFFPVSNLHQKICEGRWDFMAPHLLGTVFEFDPEVIHIIGTGHHMASVISEVFRHKKIFLWERMNYEIKKNSWPEYQNASVLV